LLAVAIGAVAMAHWPGRIDGDTLDTLREVRSGVIGDQRSTVFTWFWHWGYRLTGVGPGPVLLVQTAALLLGLYLVLRAVYSRLVAAVLATGIAVAPPTVGFVGLVGRDAWFVSAVLVAAGALVAAVRWEGRRRTAALAIGVIGLGAAGAARQNGLTAILPLAGALLLPLAARLLPERSRGRPTRRLARRPAISVGILGFAAVVVSLTVTTLATHALQHRTEHPRLYTQLYDLGYLTLALDRRVLPRISRDALPVQTASEIRGRWLQTTSIYMRWDTDSGFVPESKPRTLTAAEAAAVGSAWRRTVTGHPGTYLAGRMGLWVRQIGIGHTPSYAMVVSSARDPWGYHRPAYPALSRAVARYAHRWGGGGPSNSLTGGAVHHVWPYLLACVVGLALLHRRVPPPARAVGMLAAAGVGLQVGLFFLAPSVQWRYQLLAVHAGLVVSCVGGHVLWSAWRARHRNVTQDAR
jgi:hypothetical protein